MNNKQNKTEKVEARVELYLKEKVPKIQAKYKLKNESDTIRHLIEKEEEYDILKDGLKHMTKLMLDNPKYYHYDKEQLEMLVVMYNDIIEHTNVFLIELKEEV